MATAELSPCDECPIRDLCKIDQTEAIEVVVGINEHLQEGGMVCLDQDDIESSYNLGEKSAWAVLNCLGNCSLDVDFNCTRPGVELN